MSAQLPSRSSPRPLKWKAFAEKGQTLAWRRIAFLVAFLRIQECSFVFMVFAALIGSGFSSFMRLTSL
jgi:hypothetical protein